MRLQRCRGRLSIDANAGSELAKDVRRRASTSGPLQFDGQSQRDMPNGPRHIQRDLLRGLWRDDDGRRNSLSQNIEESFGVKPSDLPGAVALETVPGDVSDRNCPWPRPVLGLFWSSSRSLPA